MDGFTMRVGATVRALRTRARSRNYAVVGKVTLCHQRQEHGTKATYNILFVLFALIRNMLTKGFTVYGRILLLPRTLRAYEYFYDKDYAFTSTYTIKLRFYEYFLNKFRHMREYFDYFHNSI